MFHLCKLLDFAQSGKGSEERKENFCVLEI